MSKKTNRSVRGLQTQRTGLERKSAAQPLGSNASLGNLGFTWTPTPSDAAAPVPTLPIPERTSTIGLTQEIARSVTVNATSTPTRRTTARRSTTVVNKVAAMSREEEYSYIRNDLVTVFALTLILVAVLIALSFVLA